MALITQTTMAGFAAAYAALTPQGQDQILEITDTGTSALSITLNNNLGSDALTIRPIAGNEVDLSNPLAPHIIFTSASYVFNFVLVDVVRIEGFESVSTGATTGSIAFDGFGETSITIDNYISRGGRLQTFQAKTSVTTNNFLVTDVTGVGIWAKNGTGVKQFTNTVVANCNTENNASLGGILPEGASLRNVVSYGNGIKDINGTPLLSEYVATGDNTSSGVGAVTGVLATDFDDYAGGVYTAAAGGALDGTGLGGANIGFNTAAVDFISVDSIVSDQMFQRFLGQKVVVVSGTYNSAVAPTSIEVSISGGAYATLDAAPAGGTFTGVVVLPTGVSALNVRITNVPAVTTALTNLRVGDIYLCAISQSNHTDVYGIGAFTGPAGYCAEFTDGTWKDIVTTPNTSYFAVMANAMVANENVPVGFVKVAQGSTSVAQWNPDEGGVYLGIATAAFTASGGEGVLNLSWIGEQDAQAGTLEAAFKTSANGCVDNLFTDTGLRTLAILIPDNTASGDNIHQWWTDISVSNSNVDLGPSIVGLQAGEHYDTVQETQDVADAVYNVLFPAVSSTLNMTITGIPDGTYKTTLVDPLTDLVVSSTNVTFSGTTGAEVVPLAAGAEVKGFIDDGLSVPLKGAVVYGVTS